jgi:lipid-A-disaccharide synthase
LKYYVISGEASGDLHASNLIRELKKLDSAAEFRGWGGDLMIGQGVEVVKHIRDLAFMGFNEVLANLKEILNNIKFCKQDILNYKPDALILVDYPGFNLRIAKWAKENDLKVFYYISPTVWAWKEGRVENIRRDAVKLFAILPFEKAFYAKHNIDVDYEGHPLLDAFENNMGTYGTIEDFKKENQLDERPIIAVLPGSRKQEIKFMFPEMLKVFAMFPEFQFVIAGAPALDLQVYEQYMDEKKVRVLFGKTYQILNFAHAGIITSGTATLETALFNVPQVVCYKTGGFAWWLGRKIVNFTYASLVNLILNRPVLKELLQHEMKAELIAQELRSLTADTPERKKMLEAYQETRRVLGGAGVSERIAKKLIGYLKKNNTGL